MIRHPELNVREILALLTSGEHLPDLVGAPLSDTERAREHAHIVEIAQNTDNIKIVCVGCDGTTPLLEAAACVCGGFVCPTCQQLEPDGECDHTPHVLPEGATDDDE